MTTMPTSAPPVVPPRFPPGNSHGGAFLRPLPEYMALVATRFRLHFDNGMTMQAIADRYEVAPADVFRSLNGDAPHYSPRIVERVLGIHTQEVRLIARVAPGAEPLPDVVYLDMRGGAVTESTSDGLTLRQVADRAGCTLRTVQRYVRQGIIPIVELVPGQPASHRVARVPEAEAEAWIAWYRAERKKGAA